MYGEIMLKGGLPFFYIKNNITNVDEKKTYDNFDSVKNYISLIVKSYKQPRGS